MTTQKQNTKPAIPNVRPSVTDLVRTKFAEKTKREILIDDEFKSLIPLLSDPERVQLEENLKREGCRDPLVIWKGQNVLIDGHHRYEICEREGIAYEVVEVGFESREKAVDWICRNQLGRRNLNPVDASVLRGTRYNGRKKSKAEAGAKGGASKAQNDTCLVSTAEIVAKETGVSAATIKRDGRFADALDRIAKMVPDIKEKVRSGEVTKAAVLVAAKAIGIPAILDPGQSRDLSDSGGSAVAALTADEQRTNVDAGGITAVEAAAGQIVRSRPRRTMVPSTAAPAVVEVDSQTSAPMPMTNGSTADSSLDELLARAAGSSHSRRVQVIETLLRGLPDREIQAVLDRCNELLVERQISKRPPCQTRRGHRTTA